MSMNRGPLSAKIANDDPTIIADNIIEIDN
mgnify:FL=1